MPSVRVVPVYVEVLDVERAVMALESYLRRAGYIFHTGEPLPETLDDTRKRVAATESAMKPAGYRPVATGMSS